MALVGVEKRRRLRYATHLKMGGSEQAASVKQETRQLENSPPFYIVNRTQGKGRSGYIVFGTLLLDGLLRDDVPRGKQDGRSRTLCRKWPLKEQVIERT